ncbi:MAG: hypothetical protein HYZ37_05455 [Candidatus Solibacter usitatus]|nr:hypothetical protein [Candidatus Solibacter usitatus]
MTLDDAPRDMRTVVSYFDPMLPDYVEQLRATAGEGIVVIIATPPDVYLEPRARAELAASLSFVKAVVIDDSTSMDAAQTKLLDTEARLRAEFFAHVRRGK